MKKLYNKYIVKRADGKTDPKAEYFVLRIDNDYRARIALYAYARVAQDTEPEFAKELVEWADRADRATHKGAAWFQQYRRETGAT